MKMTKILALVLSVVMLVSVLAACGGSNTPAAPSTPASSNTPASTEAPSASEATKSYQLIGNYTEEGEYASILAAAFMLNLNADGTATCDKYAYMQYNTDPADSNPTFVAGYLSGTWKEVEKDGVPCLQIKLADQKDGNAQTAYAYEVAGSYSFEMTFPVTPGASYTRNVVMEGGEAKTYNTPDEFIQGTKVEFVAPEHIAEIVDEENHGTAYLQEDGTLLIYAGFDKIADGKWMTTADGLSVSIGGEAVDVANDGTTASFTYTRSMGEGFETTYNFVCSDVSALPAAEIAEDAPYTCAVDMGGNVTNAELTLNADGTANLKVFTDMPCTYTQMGSVVVLEAAGELEGYAAQIFPNVSHAFILNEDHSMTGVKAAYEAGSLVLVCLNDTDMKVMFPSYGMEREGFTYELSEDGTTMTVTAPGEDVLGAFGQIWAGSGAETWTIEGNTAVAG